MKKYSRSARILIAVHLFGFCAAIPALASEDGSPNRRTRRVAAEPKVTTETTSRDLPVEEDQSGTALAIYLGAGGTFYSVTASDGQYETNKSGFGYQGRAGLTFFNRSLALELGAGWMQSSVSSTTPMTTISGNTTTQTRAQVDTRVGIVDFSPRLRLGNHFELGPSAGVLFGTNASFGTTVSSPDSPILGGLKAVAVFQTRELHFRVVAQAHMTLSIPERQVMMASVGLEIGLPLIRGKTIVRETQVREVQEKESVEYIETEVPVIQKVEVVKEVVREVVRFSFDDQVVHFEFDRSELTRPSAVFVKRLGEFLAENQQLWTSLKVEGHTDSRGTPEYNLRLSEARAATVRENLGSAGVPHERMTSRGVGLTSPVDRGPSDVSRARNRRVELSFTGVNDVKALQDAINRIRFETTIPKTCVGDRCR